MYGNLKAIRSRLQDYPYKPPDYRHTEEFLGLVMIIICYKPEGNQTGKPAHMDRQMDR